MVLFNAKKNGATHDEAKKRKPILWLSYTYKTVLKYVLFDRVFVQFWQSVMSFVLSFSLFEIGRKRHEV